MGRGAEGKVTRRGPRFCRSADAGPSDGRSRQAGARGAGQRGALADPPAAAHRQRRSQGAVARAQPSGRCWGASPTTGACGPWRLRRSPEAKQRVRDRPRQTRGVRLPKLREPVARSPRGWRPSCGCCQTPRELVCTGCFVETSEAPEVARAAGAKRAEPLSRTALAQGSAVSGRRGGWVTDGVRAASWPPGGPARATPRLGRGADGQAYRLLRSRHAIEPPWYVTHRPGGVTGTAREGLPMSTNIICYCSAWGSSMSREE